MYTIDKRIEILEKRLKAQIFWNWVGFAIIIVGSIILLGNLYIYLKGKEEKPKHKKVNSN